MNTNWMFGKCQIGLMIAAFFVSGCGLSLTSSDAGNGKDNPFSLSPRKGSTSSAIVQHHLESDGKSILEVNDIQAGPDSIFIAGKSVPDGEAAGPGFVASYTKEGEQNWLRHTNPTGGPPNGNIHALYLSDQGSLYAAGTMTGPDTPEGIGQLVKINARNGQPQKQWEAPVSKLTRIKSKIGRDGFVVAGQGQGADGSVFHVAFFDGSGTQQFDRTFETGYVEAELTLIQPLPNLDRAAIAGNIPRANQESEKGIFTALTGEKRRFSINTGDPKSGSLAGVGSVLTEPGRVVAVKEGKKPEAPSRGLVSLKWDKPSNSVSPQIPNLGNVIATRGIRIRDLASAEASGGATNSVIGVANSTSQNGGYVFQYFSRRQEVITDRLELPENGNSGEGFRLEAVAEGPKEGTVVISGNTLSEEGTGQMFFAIVDGFSTQSTGSSRECSGDSECASGQICNAGTCEPANSGNVECTADADCSSGQICDAGTCQPEGAEPTENSCDSDSDCGAGEVCRGGACQTSESDSDECSSDADCASGQVCTAGSCTASEPSGNQCSSDADCGAGQTCNSGTCEDDNSGGAECSQDADCSDGQICEAGSCTDSDSSGDECSSDADCDSDRVCIDGRCKITA